MGFTRALPELEASVGEAGGQFELLGDRDYKELVARWRSVFEPLIQSRSDCRTGTRALESLRERLPETVIMFSGVKIPEVANLGGSGPVAYRVTELNHFDVDLARQFELVVVADDFSWCCLFSHETGSWMHEELYEAPVSAA